MTTNYEAFAQALLNRINEPGLFSAANGIQVTSVYPGGATGELTLSPGSMNPRHIVHGGCLSTLMDTVAGIAACSGGRSCVTLNSTMNYIRAVSGGNKVFCSAECIKSGKTVAVVECQVKDETGKLVTSGTYTFYLKESLAEFFHSEVYDLH